MKTGKNSNKKHIKTDGRHLGALQEAYNENLKAIREGFQLVNVKFEKVDKRFDQHTEMLGKIMEDVEIIKTDVEFLKGGLKKKVDCDEFAALARRLSLLESKSRR